MSNIERPPILVVNRCLILNAADELLLLKRSLQDSFDPGLWEFVGGKVDTEVLEEAREREISEESGLEIELVSPLVYPISHIISSGKYQGIPYVGLFSLGRMTGGSLRLSQEHDAKVWEPYNKVLEYELTSESEKALRGLGETLLSSYIK